jgi:S-DNA-T family DNA segregation ATPase FtsK/SpoIIIE
MLDRAHLARHGRGAALAVAGLFLALSLAGFDPADPPGTAADPPNAPVANPCGPVGAWLAHSLIQTFGLGAWWVLACWAVLTAREFARRPLHDPLHKLAGALLLLLVGAGACQELLQTIGRTAAVGSGGYAGAVVAYGLKGQFGPLGMGLILATAGAAGLILCHEAFLPHAAGRRVPAHPQAQTPATTYDMLAPARGHQALPVEPVARPAAIPRPGEPPVLPPAPVSRPPAQPPAIASSQPGHGGPPPSMLSASDGTFELPPMELLEPGAAVPVQEHEGSLQNRAMLLERTLLEHGCQVRVVQIDTGPVITQFEIELEAGLRVSKIVGLANDLAIALAVPSVRIVAPIPGKTTVGIEVPNERRSMVRLREVIEGVQAKNGRGAHIPLFLGKDVKGAPMAFDLADMPHLLIAGRTGTGKSVCLNAMILSILMTRRPNQVKLILIDPKMVELSQFKTVPHLMHPVVTDMKKAESLLAWACDSMDERYTFLARARVRNLHAYTALGAEEIYRRLQPESEEEMAQIPTFMPHIVIVVDEMSDMMMTAAKEVEAHIVRLAQKARAVGMHLIVATQKPTVDVITGLIKGNLPARIAFQVSSRGDSRVVLDEMGADKLLGNGDMLFLVPGTSHLVRAQGTYVGDSEVERVTDFLSQYPVQFSKELMQLKTGVFDGKDAAEKLKARDEMYEAAIEVIIREGRGSTSLLQKALGIGYQRASRLIDFMAEDGIVGEYKSGTFREVMYTWEEWELMRNGGEASDAA